jgi:hypothetical protein
MVKFNFINSNSEFPSLLHLIFTPKQPATYQYITIETKKWICETSEISYTYIPLV